MKKMLNNQELYDLTQLIKANDFEFRAAYDKTTPNMIPSDEDSLRPNYKCFINLTAQALRAEDNNRYKLSVYKKALNAFYLNNVYFNNGWETPIVALSCGAFLIPPTRDFIKQLAILKLYK